VLRSSLTYVRSGFLQLTLDLASFLSLLINGELWSHLKGRTHELRAVYTRGFCIRFSVRDSAAAQHFPLGDHVRDRATKAKEAVGQWRRRGQGNGRKKRECRECRRPFIRNAAPPEHAIAQPQTQHSIALFIGCLMRK
jgi:hypothetical protein